MLFWVNFINIAVVMQNWNNIGPNIYVSTIALLSSVMESNLFCLTNPCWWLELRSSNFNVSLVWFLNLLGVKVLISSLPKVQQAYITKILWKALVEESTIFFAKQKLFNRTIVYTTFDFLELVIFNFKFSYFSFWILDLEFWIFMPREFSWKNHADEIGNFSEK